MKRKLFSLFALALGLTVVAESVWSAPKRQSASRSRSSYSAPRGKIMVQPILGLAYTNPSKVNGVLGEQADALGIKSDYKLGTSSVFGASAEYEFVQYFSAGLRLEFMNSSTDSVSASRNGQKATLQSYITAVPLYATASARYPVYEKTKIGGTFGAGIPLVYRAGTEISASNINGLKNGEAAYSATPFTWIASVFGQYDFLPNVSGVATVGYRQLSSDQMTATSKYGGIKEGELMKDGDNANVDVNSSSILTTVGLMVTL